MRLPFVLRSTHEAEVAALIDDEFDTLLTVVDAVIFDSAAHAVFHKLTNQRSHGLITDREYALKLIEAVYC